MANGYDTFGEFEVVCPQCSSILRLSSEMYEGIEEISYNKTSLKTEEEYTFPCVGCSADLKLKIEVSL